MPSFPSECPICFDDITDNTGRTVLSCGHHFHFGCLVKWFYSQQDVPSSCAMCRKVMGPTEDLPLQEDEYEDETDDDDESDEISEEDLAKAVLLRERFATMGEDAAKHLASTKISVAFRGFLARRLYVNVLQTANERNMVQDVLKSAEIRVRIARRACQVGHLTWKIQTVTKLQGLWRGFATRNKL